MASRHVEMRDGLEQLENQRLLDEALTPRKKRVYWDHDEWLKLAAEVFRLRLINPFWTISKLLTDAQNHVLNPDRHRDLTNGADLEPLQALMEQSSKDALDWLDKRKSIEEQLKQSQKWRNLKTHLAEASEVEVLSCRREILDKVPIETLIEDLTSDEILSVVPGEKLAVAAAKRHYRELELRQLRLEEQLARYSGQLTHAAVSNGATNGYMNGHSNGHSPTNGQPVSTKTFILVLYGIMDQFELGFNKAVRSKVAEHVEIILNGHNDLNPDSIPATTSLIACWTQTSRERQQKMIKRRAEAIQLPKNNVLMFGGAIGLFFGHILKACPLKTY